MITKEVPHSEYPYELWLVFFKNKGASANIAILSKRRKFAYLYDLFSTNRGKGEASKLIREIDEYCRTRKITLVVEAEVFDSGDDGIQTDKELKSWYEKNGAMFVENNEEGHPLLLLGHY